MTPTLPEILRGNFMCLAVPPTADMAGDYMTARITVIALLNLLAAQETERGELATTAENAAITALLADAREAGYPVAPMTLRVEPGAVARDARNAELRRELIGLHQAVEIERDRSFDMRILALYREMAAGRRLDMPVLPAG